MERAIAVAVAVTGALRGQVERVVEGALGWQVVASDDVVLPPRCVLVDATSALAHVGSAAPLVLLVGDRDDPVRVARAAQHASSIVAGVPDAAALTAVVEQTTMAPAGRAAWCTVAAAAGGVGATVVATALAGLRAWQHGPTLAAVSGPTHQPSAPRVGLGELAGPAVWAAAARAVGVEDCRVVGLHAARSSSTEPTVVDAGPVPLVLERGVAPGAHDVLVARPDAAGLAAVAGTHGTVVLVGRGPVAPARIRAAAASTVVEVPWSARVAAAAAAGRVPTDVPGRWLQPLVDIVEDLVARDRQP